ncbi:hypothetical protein [Spirosoma fluminis]
MAKDEKGTHDAFEILVNSPYYWSLTGESNNLRRQFSSMLKNGKGISLDKKEDMLAKAGFTVKQEKIWKLPSGN